MALDTNIPLRAQAPNIDISQGIQNASNLQKMAALPQQMANEQAKSDLENRKLQLETAKAEVEDQYRIISSATPDNYGQLRELAVQKYGEEAAQRLPPVYDERAIQGLGMSLLSSKDKIDLAQKQIDQQFDREKFEETKRHNKASEGIFGNSLTGKAYNILLNGEPGTPEYELATSAATRPRYQQVTGPDGTTQLVAVTPELPAGIVKPPAMKGTNDITPTTPSDQLLPAPSGKGYSVTPIEGTQQAAKPTEGQSNAGLYVSRMEESNKIISDLVNNGYKPTIATDTVADSALGNFALTPQGQQFTQAKRDFINAVLRRESGAVINPDEFTNANKQYFPQPGDSKEVLLQKKRNRETAIKGIKNAAGPAYKPNTEKMDYKKMSDDEIRKSLGL